MGLINNYYFIIKITIIIILVIIIKEEYHNLLLLMASFINNKLARFIERLTKIIIKIFIMITNPTQKYFTSFNAGKDFITINIILIFIFTLRDITIIINIVTIILY